MKIVIGNVTSQAIIGGADNLLSIDLMAELKKYMRVKQKGSYFAQKAKGQTGQKGWDGYRYFVTKNGEFATGFLPYVVKFLEGVGVVPEIEDQRGKLPVLRSELITRIGDEDLREEQITMLEKLRGKTVRIAEQDVYFPRGIFDCATNSGKTTMMAGVAVNVENSKCLYITHNTLIFDDAYKRLAEIFKGEELGQIRQGKHTVGSRFTVAMIKTLLSRIEDSVNVLKQLKDVNVLFVDETHRAGGHDYIKLLKKLNPGMKVFVSGTPLDNDDKVKNMVIVGLSGPKLGTITNKELIEKGRSQKPIVTIKYCYTNAGLRGMWTYDDEYKTCIVNSPERKRLMAEEVMKRYDKQILITFNDIEHGHDIKKYLEEYPGFDLTTDLIYGDQSPAVKRSKLAAFNSGETRVLFSSMVIKEGVNAPGIRCLIRMEAGKSKITTKQISGRAMRHDGINDTVEMVDFWDVGKYITKHSRARLKIYADEGFEVVRDYDKKLERNVK